MTPAIPRFVFRLSSLIPLLTVATLLHAQTAPSPPIATSSALAPKTVSIPASLEAYEAAELYAKDSGFLSEVKADLGDHVKQGQVLATLSNPELQKQLQAAQAMLLARQEMAKAAEAAIQQMQRTRDVTRSQLAGYQAELVLAQATLKRQEELFAGKAITSQQLDEVRAKSEVARAQSEVAQAKVAASEADITAAQANFAVAKSQITVADAEVQRLQTLLQYTSITAPFDGIITRRMVSRGDLVQSGANNRATPLFTCQRLDIIRIFCDVPESSAAAVVPGTAASIRILGLDNQVLTGSVTRIATALNAATRTMRAEIDLQNPDEKLRPGMYAQVTLTLPQKP